MTNFAGFYLISAVARLVKPPKDIKHFATFRIGKVAKCLEFGFHPVVPVVVRVVVEAEPGQAVEDRSIRGR